MNTLVRQRADIDWQQLRNTGAPHREPDVHDDTLVVDAESGDPMVLVARIPDTFRTLFERARLAVETYPRGSVRRQSGTANECSTFGYLAGNVAMRRYGCRSCGPATTAPEQHAVVCALAEPLTLLLQAHLPARAAADALLASQIGPDWRLEGSPWTSGVINYDSPLPYHRDANNLHTWSAMVVWRRRTTGGNLHVPDYDLTLPCRDAEVIYFPGWALGHAVTPLSVKARGYRRTAVFYTVARMRGCAPADDQVRAAQAQRTTGEDNWKDRQRAAGLLTEATDG